MDPSPGACPYCAAPMAAPGSRCFACGRLPPEPRGATGGDVPPEVGMVLEGRYLVNGLISRGGMGSVFQGMDTALQRPVAIKFLAERFRSDEELVDRFLREARATASLQHPNIVAVYSVGEQDGKYYFVMSYVAGRTLGQLIKAKRRLPLQQALHIVGQVCDGLTYVHGSGYVHRDIKPNNVIVEPGGRCILLDFGILRSTDSEHTRSGLIAGTPEYMAPEQARDARSADARSDLYALGVTFFEMVTGRLPFMAPSDVELLMMHQKNPPPSALALAPDLPPWIDSFIAQAMAKGPERRFQTAEEFHQALRSGRVVGGPAGGPQPVASVPLVGRPSAPPAAPNAAPARARPPAEPASPSPAPAPAPARPRTRRWPVVLALSLVAGWGAVVVWYLMRKPAPEPRHQSEPSTLSIPGTKAKPPKRRLGHARARSATRAPPRLTIRSHPAGATVRAGAVRLGRTPLRSVKLDPGAHTVTLEKRGFRVYQEIVVLDPGDRKTVDADLQPLRVPVTIVTMFRGKAVWANVAVDGKALGSSPIVRHMLTPGPHVIVVTRPGFAQLIEKVRLRPGRPRQVTLKLRKK